MSETEREARVEKLTAILERISEGDWVAEDMARAATDYLDPIPVDEGQVAALGQVIHEAAAYSESGDPETNAARAALEFVRRNEVSS